MPVLWGCAEGERGFPRTFAAGFGSTSRLFGDRCAGCFPQGTRKLLCGESASMSLARAILSWETLMRQFCLVIAAAIATFAPIGSAQTAGPYKVLKTARVGGEGGWDYIYADTAGRRLYIPRRGAPATPEVQTRLSIYNLDTLEPAGEIAGVGGQGAAVDPKSGHGFTSSKPISMFDT